MPLTQNQKRIRAQRLKALEKEFQRLVLLGISFTVTGQSVPAPLQTRITNLRTEIYQNGGI